MSRERAAIYRIKGNEEADEAAKESLEKDVETTHKVVKTDWSGWTRKKNV
jgi:hypothetical protein